MHKAWKVVVAGVVALGIGHIALAHQGDSPHEEEMETAAAGHQQTLTGEVIDVMCYLTQGSQGMGASHADCGKKCIKSGLPVALKVGDQLYLATMADHQPANGALADLVGKSVTVQGTVLARDGQRVIAISKIEKAQ